MSEHLSVSQIKLFKACRRAYKLKYVYGVVPVQTAESLQTGARYHEKLEQLYNDGDFDASDLSRESAMATAYKKYIYPQFKVESAEKWVELDTGEVPLIGRVDAVAKDGRIVEHKTTSLDLNEYEYGLQWDEQIPAYMLMTGARAMYYTICKKPTIRQKKDETDEEFFARMIEWYDTDTDSKIRLLLVERTDEEVMNFLNDFKNIRDDIALARRYNDFYRNTCHCRAWGRKCEYAAICFDFNPDQEYIGFTRKEEEDGSD